MNTKPQEQLLSLLLAYRYEQEVRIIQKELGDHKQKGNARTGIKKVAGNFADKVANKQENLEDDLQKALDHRDAYVNTLDPSLDVSIVSDETKLRDLANEVFDKDDGTARMAMGLNLCFLEGNSNLPALLRSDASRKKVSRVLFNDEQRLGKMLEVYLYCVQRISGTKTKLDPEDKQLIGGAAYSIGFGLFLASTMTGGLGLLFAGVILECSGLVMAGKGLIEENQMKKSKGELLQFSSLVYSSDIKKGEFGKKAGERLQKAGREATAKGHVYSLASAITFYNFRFENKDTEMAKEALSGMLEVIDALRADAQYLTLVEKQDIDENYKKVLASSRAIELLYALAKNDLKYQEKNVEIPLIEAPKKA